MDKKIYKSLAIISLITLLIIILFITYLKKNNEKKPTNSWQDSIFVNYKDIPQQWEFKKIPETPFEIPLPKTATIEKDPHISIFSLTEDSRTLENWEKDFNIILTETIEWNSSLNEYSKFLNKKESIEFPGLVLENDQIYNKEFNLICPIIIYETNGIPTNERLTNCTPNRDEYVYLYNKKIYRFILRFDEHNGGKKWGVLALKNIRISKK